MALSRSRMRMTTDSPWTVGRVTTRMSTARPSTAIPTRPSWASRRSEMSSSAMILARETMPPTIRRGTVAVEARTPSTRKRTRSSRPSGSRWMSEAPSSTAWAMIELSSLMTGASSADSCRSMTSPASPSCSATSEAAAWTTSSRRVSRVTSAEMPSRDATAGRTSMPVIRAMSSTARTLAGSAMATSSVRSSRKDGEGVVALGRRGPDQVRRPHVDLEGGQVEVVEAVALGDRPREPFLVERAGLHQHPLRRVSRGAGRRDGLVDTLAADELHLDQHIGEEARTAATRRCRDAVVRAGRARGARRGGGLAPDGTEMWRVCAVHAIPLPSTRPGPALIVGHAVGLPPGRPGQAAHRARRSPRPRQPAPARAARSIASRGAGRSNQRSKASAPWATSTASPSTTGTRADCAARARAVARAP